ncbi:hypothetical protein ACFFKU_07260 [Kineococcus gynurae]|uniref:Capsular polysaccharide biosynthesis protein n=1 Tax=Kineococcus gynurae TaxID=452979 RepID=A0ABV5LWS9_9ACTN
MTIGSLMRVLARRWYLTVLLLVGVFFAARSVWNDAVPQYQVSTNVMVLPSVALSTPLPDQAPGTQPGSRNPFSLAGGASTLAANVSSALQTSPVQAGLLASAPDAEITIGSPSSGGTNRTYFTVSAQTATPEQGTPLLQAVVAATNTELTNLQRAVGAPDNGLFIAVQSTPIDGPRELYPDRNRAVGAVALGVLGAGVVLILVLDALIGLLARRRSRSRSDAAEATATDAAPSSGTPTPGTRETAPGTVDVRTAEATRGSAGHRAGEHADAR